MFFNSLNQVCEQFVNNDDYYQGSTQYSIISIVIYVYDLDEDDIEEPQVLYFLGLVREPPARILLLPLDCRFILGLNRITCTIGLIKSGHFNSLHFQINVHKGIAMIM